MKINEMKKNYKQKRAISSFMSCQIHSLDMCRSSKWDFSGVHTKKWHHSSPVTDIWVIIW